MSGNPDGAPARRLSHEDLATLDVALLELVRSKVPLPAGLTAYASGLASGRLTQVMADLRKDLEQGASLSDALGRRGDAVPPIYRALVAAGEASGDLPSVLAILAEQAEIDAEIARRARDTLAYPALTLFAAIAGTGALAAYVLPKFREMFDQMGVELPVVTELVLDVADLMQARGAAGVAIFLVLGAGAFVLLTRLGPRIAPGLIGGASSRRVGEIARALSAFLRRGVPADKAFRALAEAQGRSSVRDALGAVARRLEEGGKLADALRPEPAFPSTFIWLVGAAEQRGTLPDTLADLALQHERGFRRRLRLIETLVAPFALLIVGILIATSVLAVFLPIFKLQQMLMQ